MSQIQFFTPTQESLIPEYQEKWRQVYRSTEPIDPDRAKAAIEQAYAVMGRKAPEITFCLGPQTALEHLQASIPQELSPPPPKETLNCFHAVVKFVRLAIELNRQWQQAATRPIYDLLDEVSKTPSKLLTKYVSKCLSKDVSAKDIIEQLCRDPSPLFDRSGKNFANQRYPEYLKTPQDKKLEGYRKNWHQVSSNFEAHLVWPPAQDLLYRWWLKQQLPEILIKEKVYGIAHPQLLANSTLWPSFQKVAFLSINLPVITSNFGIYCIWLDFAFSVLNYPCRSRKWTALQDLAKHCGWIFAVNNLCVVCDRPTKLFLDDNNQLHAEGEPALEFADGSVFYAYHGTLIPEKYGTIRPRQWQPKWLFEEKFQDRQQALAQAIGAARLCQELPVIKLGEIGEYAFLKIRNIKPKSIKTNTTKPSTMHSSTRQHKTIDIQILRRIDPKTGRVCAVFLPEDKRSIWPAIHYVNQNISAEDFPLPGY